MDKICVCYQSGKISSRNIPFKKTAVCALLCLSPAVLAQSVNIDGGQTITVPGNQTSPWTMTGSLTVGNTSLGSLTISSGGTVSNTYGSIGNAAGSTGVVEVTGSGSSWTNFGNLVVGDGDSGTLNIINGGTVTNSIGFIGGQTAGGNGIVTVDGTGSKWTNSDLYVGYFGSGTLAITNSGTVNNAYGYIGRYTGSSGAVTVDGAGTSWTNSGHIYVGDYGDGTLAITNGAQVSNERVYIGYQSSGFGTVTVDGADSTLTNRTILSVGFSGSGMLAITNGAQVSNASGYIGQSTGGSGTVTVDGTGSSWTNSYDLFVGHNGNGSGTLAITNGGQVSSTYGYIGLGTSNSGTVTVNGAGSSWINSDVLAVGNRGSGALTISDYGLVSAGDVYIALDSTASGSLDVTSGGILQALSLNAGDGSVAATFDSGTLRALADNQSFITGFAVGELVINVGGLVLDDQGFAVATDSSAFTGIGGLNKIGSGTFTLNGHNTYGGVTTVASGTLQAGIANALSPTSAVVVNVGGVLDANGLDQTIASLSNKGSVVVGSNTAAGAVGSTLTVSSNYTGNNGLLTLRTVLGDSSSLTDRLVIQGNATGQTGVRVINAGGVGADTTGDGILIIQVDGTSAANAFTLSAPVTAGIYEYQLNNGSGAQAQNWYLQSHRFTSSEDTVLYNPNIGSYLGNQYAAATLFNHNILDRRDSTRSPDQTLWVRSHFNRMQTDILGGRQEATIKTGVLQIGADLIQRDNLIAGVYAGYGYSDINNKSKQTGTKADGRVNGYQVGIYGSLLPQGNTGLYADAWAYHAWYDNKLSGAAQYRSTQYDSTGYAVSGEVGYGFELLSQEGGRAWVVEPHAQLIYTHIDADNFYDSHGTRYTDNQASGVQSRLGARLYGQNAPGRYGVSPFIEANWLHNNMSNRIRMNGDVAGSRIGRNVGEVKVGLQGLVTERLSVWGHVGAQSGSQSFERYELQAGLGWQW